MVLVEQVCEHPANLLYDRLTSQTHSTRPCRVLLTTDSKTVAENTSLMVTRRRTQFVHFTVAWQLAAVLVLVGLNALSYELFFVISLIGFLVVIELTAPLNVQPAWRRRLRWLILLGLVVFAYVVVRRILAILPPGVI